MFILLAALACILGFNVLFVLGLCLCARREFPRAPVPAAEPRHRARVAA
jgi:hypothetical protein